MGKHDELAAFLYELQRAGAITADDWVTTPEGGFFASLDPAKIASEKYGGVLERVSGQVSGWLLKPKP